MAQIKRQTPYIDVRCKSRDGTKSCLVKGKGREGARVAFAMATHEIPLEFVVKMTLSEMLVYAN